MEDVLKEDEIDEKRSCSACPKDYKALYQFRFTPVDKTLVIFSWERARITHVTHVNRVTLVPSFCLIFRNLCPRILAFSDLVYKRKSCEEENMYFFLFVPDYVCHRND